VKSTCSEEEEEEEEEEDGNNNDDDDDDNNNKSFENIKKGMSENDSKKHVRFIKKIGDKCIIEMLVIIQYEKRHGPARAPLQ
jgi:hypothetical protein